MPCLYECGSDSYSKQEYHVLPKSASVIELTLAPGHVCDACNNYFSKLEGEFIRTHPGASDRLLHVGETRKGKAPKHETSLGLATREKDDNGIKLNYPLHRVESTQLENGDLKFTGYFYGPRFRSLTISRVLAKMATEFLVSMPVDHDLHARSARMAPLRCYARFGAPSNLFLWFAWKRIPGEQHFPCVCRIENDGGQEVGMLFRVSLPGIAYLLPLPPFRDSHFHSQNLKGWNVFDKRGEIEPAEEYIETYLNRVRPPETSS